MASAARVFVNAAALLTLYYLLPLNRAMSWSVVAWLTLSLIGFAILVLLQIRSILRSTHPALRAVDAVATAVTVFVLVFATTYLILAAGDPGAFTEPLSKAGALYFTMSVLSTVGFGDIAPKTETARVFVTVQMAGNLVVLGLLARVVVGAVQFTRQRNTDQATSEEPRP